MKLEVIIVDDDEIVTYLQQSIVRECGLSSNPVCFTNGKTALDHLNSGITQTKNLLILLDINMPEVNGWEFLDAIGTLNKENKPAIIVYMVTSSINKNDKEKANQYDIIKGFIEKPLDIVTCKKIRKSLEDSGILNSPG